MRQEEQLKALFSWTKESKLPQRCKGEEITGLQAERALLDS